MNDMSFASYILNEKSVTEKMKIILYFKRKHECFFDNTVIFKTGILDLFLEHSKPDIDRNLVITACLLYACKKSVIAFDLAKVKTYAEEGASYLATLGFDEKFCCICSQINRYKETEGIREKEADILEIIDNFGMLLDRDDRRAFTTAEALFVLEHENLNGKKNVYLEDFKEFVMEIENLETLGIDRSKIITKWQRNINALPKYDIARGINLFMKYRTEAKKIYIEGKKIERNKNGIRENKQKLNAERRLNQELAMQIDENHKFSELLDKEDNIS